MAVKVEFRWDENRISDYVLLFMKNLNLITIVYISLLMYHSMTGYIREGTARELLSELHILPIPMRLVPVLAVGLYSSCLLMMSIRDVSGLGLLLKILLEILLGVSVSSVLGFSSKGIFLLILAENMRFFPKSRLKLPIAVGMCLLYLAIDADMISVYGRMIPITQYLQYYQSQVRVILEGILNMAEALNMLLFLIYMLFLIRIQTNEKERVLELNDELNQVNSKLQEANLQLERYARESEKMAETRERNRLAREIHDTLGHTLTGIIAGLDACVAIMDIAPEATKMQLQAITDVARQGMTDVRRSVKALRPDALEKLSLEEALKKSIKEMRQATQAEIRYSCTAELRHFSEDEEDVIYRIVQESITNSIRHGHADQIKIEIRRVYNKLQICIADNGIGCEEVKKGFGLHHMEERIQMLQGSLEYESKNGFTVRVELPIRWGQEE